MKTIVLAYSGGLDTSIIVPWLREKYDARIICVAADIGQGPDELAGVRAKALASGAEECYVEDLREEFIRDFIYPTLRAGAIYNRKYLLGTSMARPLIAKRQVEVARAVGADALAQRMRQHFEEQIIALVRIDEIQLARSTCLSSRHNRFREERGEEEVVQLDRAAAARRIAFLGVEETLRPRVLRDDVVGGVRDHDGVGQRIDHQR